MAERRMLTKKVTDDDNFMSLSSSAQALYLHLSMNADDDGFCNQVAVSMFKAHASVQDLQALLEKRYIYQFDSGVIVIKHWRMANALRKDRYTQTAFKEELAKLKLKENGAYTLRGEDELLNENNDGCRLVATCLPQDRVDKSRVDKVNNREGTPTLEEVQAYVKEKGLKMSAEGFFDHFTANGWRQSGGNKIKDWKAACRNWARRERDFGKQKQSVFSSDASYDLDDFKNYSVGSPAWIEREKRNGRDVSMFED